MTIQPWRWRQQTSPKRWLLPTNPHGDLIQNNINSRLATSFLVVTPWRWGQYVNKRWYVRTNPDGSTIRKTTMDILKAVRTSNLIMSPFIYFILYRLNFNSFFIPLLLTWCDVVTAFNRIHLFVVYLTTLSVPRNTLHRIMGRLMNWEEYRRKRSSPNLRAFK
jgi:hypothetical protein